MSSRLVLWFFPKLNHCNC
uniref:Uncharacterized protein n=1 Tax=Rhizophora mucronata TaxID=61149 RepID=A0A2P2NCA0_RHIMU